MKQPHWILLAFVFCGVTQSGQAADLPVIERKITKEPAYQTRSPGYALLVFGKEGRDWVWMVHDGDVLYVDRNGNGDLTEPGERIERQKPRKGFEDATGRNFEVGEVKVGGLIHKGLSVSTNPLKEYATGGLARRQDFQDTIKKHPEGRVYSMACDVEVPGIKGGGLDGRLSVLVGILDVEGFLLFGQRAQDAPLIRMGGPIHIRFSETIPRMRKGTPTEMMVSIGFPGKGPGTFAAIGYEDTLPPDAKPVIEVEVVSKTPGGPVYREKYELPNQC